MKRSTFILICISLILLFTSCVNLKQVAQEQYQFPLGRSDLEKVLNEHKIDWFIEDDEYTDELQTIYTLRNDDNITMNISSKVTDDGNVLNMIWILSDQLEVDKVNEFYNEELPKFFTLTEAFYGSNKKLNKGLNEFLEYYLKNDYEDGVYWTKAIGEDNLIVEIKPWLASKDSGSSIGSLMVISDDIYENYLRSLAENWKKSAQIQSIEVTTTTVDNISKFLNDAKNDDLPFKYLLVKGSLKEINELKIVPESLGNIESSILKENRDAYLEAKLVDETGSIDVFLQATSLNDNELKEEREHSLVLFFDEDAPIVVVRYSVLQD